MERSLQRSKNDRGAAVRATGSGKNAVGYLVSKLTEGLGDRSYIAQQLHEASLCTGIPISELEINYLNGEKITWDTDDKPKK